MKHLIQCAEPSHVFFLFSPKRGSSSTLHHKSHNFTGRRGRTRHYLMGDMSIIPSTSSTHFFLYLFLCMWLLAINSRRQQLYLWHSFSRCRRAAARHVIDVRCSTSWSPGGGAYCWITESFISPVWILHHFHGGGVVSGKQHVWKQASKFDRLNVAQKRFLLLFALWLQVAEELGCHFTVCCLEGDSAKGIFGGFTWCQCRLD